MHITEFNSSYRPDNPVHDTAFHAAYLAPVLAHGGDLADSFSYWTFSDTFEEAGVPTALFHGGFGLLTHRQIRKPAYHLYAFMARTGPDLLARGDDHLVTRHADGRIAVLAWAPVDPTGRTPAPTGTRCGCRCPAPAGRSSSAGPASTRSGATRTPPGGTWAARARRASRSWTSSTKPPNPRAATGGSPSTRAAPCWT